MFHLEEDVFHDTWGVLLRFFILSKLLLLVPGQVCWSDPPQHLLLHLLLLPWSLIKGFIKRLSPGCSSSHLLLWSQLKLPGCRLELKMWSELDNPPLPLLVTLLSPAVEELLGVLGESLPLVFCCLTPSCVARCILMSSGCWNWTLCLFGFLLWHEHHPKTQTNPDYLFHLFQKDY